MTPDQRLQLEEYDRSLGTLRMRTRAAEGRVSVFRNKAAKDKEYADEHKESLQALTDLQGELEEAETNRPDFDRDPEGTRPSMADSFGNFSRNSHVANAGGIGVKGSNSTEAGDAAEEPDEAGLDADLGPTVVHGRGGRAETARGSRLIVHPEDEVRETEGLDDEGNEGNGSRSRRSRRGRASSKRRAKEE